jgi:predicted membrane protein
MGGCELDLREARMKGGEAVLRARAVMGGIEIRVPEDWSVVVKGTPVMGAFEDSTRAGRSIPPEAAQRLIVEGAVFMGGVEIKH